MNLIIKRMMTTSKQLVSSIFAMSTLVLWTACGPSPDHATHHEDSDHQHPGEVAADGHGVDGSHSHEDGDDGHHSGVPGPNGGRLVVGVEPHLEFFMQPDRHARITFVNDDIEPIAPADLEITLTGGDRSNPVEIGFSRADGFLLSNAPLPDEQDMAIVLQVSGGENEEPVFERFHLNMATCPDCQLHEYACICGHTDHEHDDEH